jgi:hypothetical protein
MQHYSNVRPSSIATINVPLNVPNKQTEERPTEGHDAVVVKKWSKMDVVKHKMA